MVDRPLRALVLTGWGQDQASLEAALPSGIEIVHFPYHHYANRDAVLQALSELPEQPDIVLGFSLGGKIAAEACAREILKPKLFVILSSSYQLPPSQGLNRVGNIFGKFRDEPEQARSELADVMLQGDSRQPDLKMALKQDADHNQDWLRWIPNTKFGFADTDATQMPPTLIIHGDQDALVPPEQAEKWYAHIPGSRLEMLEGCGHLPHWHDPQAVADIIKRGLERLSTRVDLAVPPLPSRAARCPDNL